MLLCGQCHLAARHTMAPTALRSSWQTKNQPSSKAWLQRGIRFSSVSPMRDWPVSSVVGMPTSGPPWAGMRPWGTQIELRALKPAAQSNSQ